MQGVQLQTEILLSRAYPINDRPALAKRVKKSLPTGFDAVNKALTTKLQALNLSVLDAPGDTMQWLKWGQHFGPLSGHESKIEDKLPEQVECLSVKIMLEFERFSESTDTSSGNWMDDYSVVLDSWMKSLAAQKRSDPVFIAKKVMDFIANEIYFGPGVFKTYQRLPGTEVLRAIRDMYYQKKTLPGSTGNWLGKKKTQIIWPCINNR